MADPEAQISHLCADMLIPVKGFLGMGRGDLWPDGLTASRIISKSKVVLVATSCGPFHWCG
jgi:hypothetical protein